MSKADYFTKQFYAWEQRGRGWLCYDEPVYLEPPFIPFVRQYPLSGYVDESKRPTWISSFIDTIKGKKRETHDENNELLDYETITPFEYPTKVELTAFRVQLVKGQKGNLENVRSFLSMLSNTQSNISFEIVGNKKSIIFQFVCSIHDSYILKAFLNSYFPEYSLIENKEFLNLLSTGKNTYILDFGLKEECVRPLSIQHNLNNDPLLGIMGVLDQLEGEEEAGIQLLFQGAINNWSSSMQYAVTTSDGKSFFQDVPDAPKMTQEKLQTPLFGVSIRCFTQEKKPRILDIICNAIIQATASTYNQLIPLPTQAYTYELRESDLYLRESHRLGMLLSADELLPLLHFPTEQIKSKKLYKGIRKTTPVPKIAQNKETIIGYNNHTHLSIPVSYGINDRMKHSHLIGATGTGKSTLLANLMLQDIKAGNGIALVDPHGDLVDDILARINEKDRDKVVLIDPSDTEYPVGLNILHAHTDLEKEVLSSDLVASFKRLSTSWGDQMNTVFANAILAMLESSQGGTINELRRFLVEPAFRNTFLKSVSDPSILYYWHKEYPLIKTNSIGPILTRLDTFLRPKIIRNMVSQKIGIDFEAILNEQKILLVKLPQGLIGNENSFLLGSLILSKLHQAAFARQSQKVRHPFFLYLDEFHNFITPSIKEMLSGVRKYNMGLILSHQDLEQLKREDSELLNAVLGNTYTRIVFRVGEPDAKKLQDGFADFDFTDMQNLGRGEAIVRIEQPVFNTSIDTIPLSEIKIDEKERVIEEVSNISRSKYTKPKTEIEAIINDSLKFSFEEKESKSDIKVKTKNDPVTESTNESNTINKSIDEQNNTESNQENKKHLNDVLTTITENTITEQNEKATSQTENDNTDIIQPTLLKPTIENSTNKIEQVKEKNSVHSYLQQLIKKIGETKNYKVTIEYGIQNGSIDVVLEREQEKIAIEISVTTDPIWEVHNLEKCIGLGFTQIMSISGDKKHLAKIEKKCTELLPHYKEHSIIFVTPDQLYTLLTDETIKTNDAETVHKGYRVNVQYTTQSIQETKSTSKNIAKTLLSLKRKKKE